MDASRGRRGTHVYKHCFFNIPPNMRTHCTSKSQPPYNYHTITVQYAITVKHRTLNVPPKCKHRANIARSICRQSTNTVQISHAQCAAKAQTPCKIVRSMCRQSASTVQVSHAQSVAKVQALCKQRPFCRLFRAFSLQNLPFHPSSCSRRSQNG